ncbi:hypothetical protein ASG39_14695 [Rhizobium sp. Leaf371]|uniref:ASCH domain-containing protein n=1 Tax=Rhizobium sp. Leaf371 TaxID=1736355 RepID=UPI000712A2D0|nr:ASCH domain-containing protein [Rhizobium sp. Leaf371]KQS63850.1 hypothetical protein ASG39_14695 [Rhizobium sp. Leaf371]
MTNDSNSRIEPILSVDKALVIADPWISLILSGQKDWEMRSTSASHRGWFGLIWKGLGAVYGVARLVDVKPPQSPEQMIETVERHRIPEEMIRSGKVAAWNTPWVLADVRRLTTPVRYRHKNGAVTWVNLEDDVSEAIVRQLNAAPALQAPLTSLAAAPAVAEKRDVKVIGEVEITQGNIDHHHIYLRGFFDRFPADSVGGSNRTAKAPREISVDWGQDIVWTDLDSSKKFFRARGWIGSFFRFSEAKAGDVVIVEETASYQYRVRLLKRDR